MIETVELSIASQVEARYVKETMELLFYSELISLVHGILERKILLELNLSA